MDNPNNIRYASDARYTTIDGIDIFEDRLLDKSERLFKLLLHDFTTGNNIVWACEDYVSLGDQYSKSAPITPELITGDNSSVIQPYACKSQSEKELVDTSSFPTLAECNLRNNEHDVKWFETQDAFNVTSNNGKHWNATLGEIQFQNDMKDDGDEQELPNWRDYVLECRIGDNCGEAIYIASRYDIMTGRILVPEQRIGFLDRKIRIVCERCGGNEASWLAWMARAFQSSYGYEYRGDRVLLARENLLYTFQDAVKNTLGRDATVNELTAIAEIISRNIWQMDECTGKIPVPVAKDGKYHKELSSDIETNINDFGGEFLFSFDDNCQHHGHVETWQPPCMIRDWSKGKVVPYRELFKE